MDKHVNKAYSNILPCRTRQEFRAWLMQNASCETECWLELKRGRPVDDDRFWYLDAVEEALCFGWIDSTQALVDGRRLQRFTPRKNTGLWTELNKARARRLIKLGLMTDAGRKVLPPLGPRSFRMAPEVETALRQARVYSRFMKFPPLYRRVRAYNVAFYLARDRDAYQKALDHLIAETKAGRMYGGWNDYGRLPED